MCFTTIRLEIVPLALIRIHGLDLLLQTDGDEPSSRLLEETLLDRGLSFNKVFKHVWDYHWREVCEGRTRTSLPLLIIPGSRGAGKVSSSPPPSLLLLHDAGALEEFC